MGIVKFKTLVMLTVILLGGTFLKAYAVQASTIIVGNSSNRSEQQSISSPSGHGWVLRDDKWFYYFADGRQAADEWIREKYIANLDSSYQWPKEDDERRTKNPYYTWESCSYETGMFYMYADGGYLRNGRIGMEHYLSAPDGTPRGGWIRQVVQGQERDEPFYTDLYYLDPSNGKVFRSEWLEQEGKRYYFSGSGTLVTNRWIIWKNKWYYLTEDGSMAVSTITPDGYQVDENGIWLEGEGNQEQDNYIGTIFNRIPMSRSNNRGDNQGGNFYDSQLNKPYQGWIRLDLYDAINGTLYNRSWSYFNYEGELTDNTNYPTE